MRPGQLAVPFKKFTGSGNDFIFFDTRSELVARDELETPGMIASLCARGTGIGADGAVFVAADDAADLRIRYYNADGSRASLCGNAGLCTVRFAAEQEIGGKLRREVTIATDAGLVTGRITHNDWPEIDLDAVTDLVVDRAVTVPPAEARRIGFAVVGVPHLVVLVGDVASIDVVGVGRPLRRDPRLGAPGANVNFVSAAPGFPMRTYERGVEGETLACGTGAVATAALLVAWGLANEAPVSLSMPRGLLSVRFSGGSRPSLKGEGRLVFEGTFPVD
jgi:diaminopimelate epimerase